MLRRLASNLLENETADPCYRKGYTRNDGKIHGKGI